MRSAWIENAIIRDICRGNPAECYHPDIAKFYDAEVPGEANNGDGWDGVTLTKPIVSDPVFVAPELPKPPTVSAIVYKMLFTGAERIAAKTSTDPIIVDLQDLLNDPRTTTVDLSLQSISDALDYLTNKNIIAAGRKAEILTGRVK